MKHREQSLFEMIKRVVVFGAQHMGEISTPVPPKKTLSPGQVQAEQIFDDLMTDKTGLLAQIAQTAETQQSGTGTARDGTSTKTMLRAELLSGLRGINRTAYAIAEAGKTPGIVKLFRMPYSVSDITLAARASAMTDAAEGMKDDFVNYYHAETFADDLRALIKAFDDADETQDTGTQTHVGATATFGPLLRQAMTKVKQLDAFIQNFYKDNATALGEWKTASHVQRAPQRQKKPAPGAAPESVEVQAGENTGVSASSPVAPAAYTNGNGVSASNGAGSRRLARV